MDQRSNISATDLTLLLRLKARRERMELSQIEVARLMSEAGVRMSQTAVSRAELGTRALTVGEAHVYAQILGTSIAELLRDDPIDELVADTRARLRAADVSRRSALAALENHARAIDAILPTLAQLSEAVEHSKPNPELHSRLTEIEKQAILDAQALVGQEIETGLAETIDALSHSTAATAALRYTHGEEPK